MLPDISLVWGSPAHVDYHSLPPDISAPLPGILPLKGHHSQSYLLARGQVGPGRGGLASHSLMGRPYLTTSSCSVCRGPGLRPRCGIDLSPPVSREPADKVWRLGSQHGTTCLSDPLYMFWVLEKGVFNQGCLPHEGSGNEN